MDPKCHFQVCMHNQSCPTLCDPMDYGALSMGLSWQEFWSGLSFPPPGDLSEPGMEIHMCGCIYIYIYIYVYAHTILVKYFKSL